MGAEEMYLPLYRILEVCIPTAAQEKMSLCLSNSAISNNIVTVSPVHLKKAYVEVCGTVPL